MHMIFLKLQKAGNGLLFNPKTQDLRTFVCIYE